MEPFLCWNSLGFEFCAVSLYWSWCQSNCRQKSFWLFCTMFYFGVTMVLNRASHSYKYTLPNQKEENEKYSENFILHHHRNCSTKHELVNLLLLLWLKMSTSQHLWIIDIDQVWWNEQCTNKTLIYLTKSSHDPNRFKDSHVK